jgi:rhombotail lipoprotein
MHIERYISDKGEIMRHSTALLLLCAALAGCSTPSKHTATSAVDFLYPNVREPVVTPETPVLRLPLRVGIAFVPADYRGNSTLTETKKTEVLEQVANHFRKSRFVRSIEVIPSAYLRPKGGFGNLDQVRTMYGVDVIALVSYDQAQFTDQGLLSLTYWTIVGAYVVRGQKNDTHTMLDTVVYDISSRKLLFRAPGTSEVKASSTYVNMSEQLRANSEAGFAQATTDMISNLDTQLVAFQEKVKQRPEEYRVERTASYGGSGALDGVLCALAGALFVGAWRRRRT